jgi:hypothetical protein
MATKLNSSNAKRLQALKINVKSEEEAREKLVEILTQNGVEGMEDEEIEILIDIAESFIDSSDGEPEEEPIEEEDDEEVSETEKDLDELAEEVEIEEKKAKKVAKKETKPAEKKVAKKEEPIEEEDDEEEAPKTTKKEKKAKDEKPTTKKETKPAEEKVAKKKTSKINPKENEEDRKYFKVFEKLFPTKDFEYAWVVSAGVNIKYKGKNSLRSVALIENCSIMEDGDLKCNFYLTTFTKNLEVLDNAEIDYEICWSGAPFIKGIAFKEVLEILEEVKEHIIESTSKNDKKLGENRQKMEEELNKKAAKKEEPKATVKKTTKKK